MDEKDEKLNQLEKDLEIAEKEGNYDQYKKTYKKITKWIKDFSIKNGG